MGFVIALAVTVWALSSAPPGGGASQLATTPWLGCGVVLELSAPRLGRFGFFSLASGPLLAVVLRWPDQTGSALIALWLGLLLRSLVRGASTPFLRSLEALSDGLPLVLTVALLKAVPALSPWAAAGAFAFAFVTAGSFYASALPHDVREEWSSYRTALQWGGLAMATVALLVLPLNSSATQGPWLVFVLLVVLSRLAPLAMLGVDARERTFNQRETDRKLQQRDLGLQATEEILMRTGAEQRRSAAELETRLEAYMLVERMLEGISLRPVLRDVAQQVIARVWAKVRCQSVVLFWKCDERLVALAQRTPHGDRILSAPLLGATEPVIARALQLQRSERELPQDSLGERIFLDERATLAIPMRDRGVLYFGHPQPFELDDDARHFLQVLANLAVIALEAADLYQRLQDSHQREAEIASRNEALVQRLAQVIDAVTALVQLRDPSEMLAQTGQHLEHLISHQARLLWRDDGLQSRLPDHDNEVLLNYARTARDNGRPLLLESFSSGRFPSPMVGCTSLLAVPLMTDQGARGAVVLVRQGGASFTREDQDILSVMIYQLAAALNSAQLYSELDSTHQALKESQAKVVQSSKMAAIGQLAGGVAHELNTPLGAIALAIDGALATLHSKPERAESRLQRAATSVQQMKEIVSKLLFYSRDARSGRRDTDLNQVIHDTLQLIGHQLRLDRVEVATDLAQLPTLVANQNELQQVFTNLCLNAKDACLMEQASARKILITTRAEGEFLCVRVRDWGGGMGAATREKIFDPFFTTKDVGKGTGLGLSVTMELVQQHDGQLSVVSELGQGSEFTVRLPKEPVEPRP